MLKANITKSM